MKTIVSPKPILAFIFICAVDSCSKAPLNEIDGSLFYLENASVVFEDKGYMIKDDDGNLAIACYSGPKIIGENRKCINILIPPSCYSLSENQLTFHNSSNARVRLFTELPEPEGHALINISLQQDTKVHLDGKITNDTKQDFWSVDNIYCNPISLSFSLEDGIDVRLGMKTMTVVDDYNLLVGWLP